MSTNLVILRRPPGRALFNVKSRTLRVLTMAFLLMEIVLSPWQLLSFFSFFIEQDARTYTNSKTRYELRKELTLGYSHTSPTLGVCKTSSVWSSSLLLQLFLHQGTSRCCNQCSSHVYRRCLSIVLFDLPLKWLATKNTRRKTISQNMLLLFIEREINKWINKRQSGLSPGSALFLVISSTMITLVAIISDGSLFHHQLLKLATRLVSRCMHKIGNVYDKYIHLQPTF